MKKIVPIILIFAALLAIISMAAHQWSPRPTLNNRNDMTVSPTLIRLGDPKNSDLNGPDASIDNHPTGAKFYQREWETGNLGTVEFVDGKHSFMIDNVLSTLGFADKDVPDGIYQWSISFGVSPEQADTHEVARARVMKFLAQLRAAGWKRYIDKSFPRLNGSYCQIWCLGFGMIRRPAVAEPVCCRSPAARL